MPSLPSRPPDGNVAAASTPWAAASLTTAGMLWVAWPKRASKVPTDLTEDRVRAHGLAGGLVDVKVCAVDEVWSGLKFVRRVRDRYTFSMLPLRPALIVVLVWACSPPSNATSRAEARRSAAEADSSFADVQRRGHTAMGVDQYTSTHLFQPLPDGGRIELQRDTADSGDRMRILEHMGEIAAAFGAGDFTVPGFVHAREVPGTAVMAARRARISYAVESLPRGAAVRLTTRDSSALEAIHEFLAFQGQDHRAGTHH